MHSTTVDSCLRTTRAKPLAASRTAKAASSTLEDVAIAREKKERYADDAKNMGATYPGPRWCTCTVHPDCSGYNRLAPQTPTSTASADGRGIPRKLPEGLHQPAVVTRPVDRRTPALRPVPRRALRQIHVVQIVALPAL